MGVSAVTGEGMDDFFAALQTAANDYNTCAIDDIILISDVDHLTSDLVVDTRWRLRPCDSNRRWPSSKRAFSVSRLTALISLRDVWFAFFNCVPNCSYI